MFGVQEMVPEEVPLLAKLIAPAEPGALVFLIKIKDNPVNFARASPVINLLKDF